MSEKCSWCAGSGIVASQWEYGTQPCAECGGSGIKTEPLRGSEGAVIADLRARLAAAERERDHAEARLDLILDDAVRFAERDAPPLAFAKDALLVPIEAYNERANQAFTFAGAAKMLQAALKEQTECSTNERIQRRAAEERARKAANERTAQIVAWLRRKPHGEWDPRTDFADPIERGDYEEEEHGS